MKDRPTIHRTMSERSTSELRPENYLFVCLFVYLFICVFVSLFVYLFIFVVRMFSHGAMGRQIDPSWGGPIEIFLVPASAPRLV